MPAGPPRIHFAQTEVDLGDVAVSAVGHKQSFPVTNRGLSPLKINLLESGCACLNATVSHTTIDPEQQAAVIVHLRTDQAGRRSTDLVVHSDDPAQPRVRLTATWRVRAPIELVPDTLDFGTVRPGTNVVATVRMVRQEKHGPAASPTNIEWRVDPQQSIQVEWRRGADDRGDVLEVSLTPGSELGMQTGLLVGTIVDDSTELRLPLRWSVRDVIEATPSRLSLGTGAPGEEREARLILAAHSETPLEIAEIDVDGVSDWLTVSSEAISRDRTLVKAFAILKDSPGVHTGDLFIACRSPEERTVRVPVSVYVSASNPPTLTGDVTGADSSPRGPPLDRRPEPATGPAQGEER